MLYTTILLYGIIEYYILGKFNENRNNFLISLFAKSIIAIPIYLAIYLPFRYFFGEIMIASFIILFTTILLVNFLGTKVTNLETIKYQKYIAVIGIIITYVIMAVLTFNAPRTDLFFDTEEEKYGINDYLIKK